MMKAKSSLKITGCKVSRADQLERRIKQFCNQLDSIEIEVQDDYLQMEWTPQATGIVHVHTSRLDPQDSLKRNKMQ